MSTRTRWARRGALLLSLALLLAACGGGRDDDSGNGGGAPATDNGNGNGNGEEVERIIDASDCPDNGTVGVTDTSIKFGSSFPQSGLFAAFAEISKGYIAYFNYINEVEGGVDGRKIEVVTKDDGYEPNATVQNVNEMVQRDQVFALFNIVGTPNNLAIWDDLGDECIPNLFAGTGSPNWGDEEGHPWTIGSIASYAVEAGVFVEYLKQEMPEATVAILAQNDDFGRGYVTAFKDLIEGTDITIAREETYEPSDPAVDTQATTLAASRADALLLAATVLKCPQALDALQRTGWEPTIYLSATCTSPRIMNLAQPGAGDGVLSTGYLKDPLDPQWADDEAMTFYKETARQYGPAGIDVDDGLTGYGWTMGHLLVETLKQAPALTRLDVMEAARQLDGLEVGLLLPDVTITTSPGDPYPIESMRIARYSDAEKRFVLEGDLISFEGESGEFARIG